jgi:1-acyl-sn-glycerol-3-phosphate acyltransferase
LFRPYVKWLFKFRFKSIWINQRYRPSETDRTVYFLNHTSWWDGLIPFMLNEYRFRQRARAMMELKQMKTYPFFKWLGAFSIKQNERMHTIASLRYAIASIQRAHSGLYIFPGGEIVPATETVQFKPGISWLRTQLPNADFVPVGIHIHTVRHNKPELHILVDEKMELSADFNRHQINGMMEERMNSVLLQLRETAGFDDSHYESFF